MTFSDALGFTALLVLFFGTITGLVPWLIAEFFSRLKD